MRKIPPTSLRFARILPAFVLLWLNCRAAENMAVLTLESGAAPSSIAVGADVIKLDASHGGFFAREVRTGATLDLSKGALRTEGKKSIYEAHSPEGIKLHAVFEPRPGYVLVEGYLENTRTSEDRAVILDYLAGLTGNARVFSSTLNQSEDVALAGDGVETEVNAVPVAALQADDKALAMGIPGDAPCSFGMVGSSRGLAVRFYLGLTPDTRAFPNRARFAFIVYPAVKGWGFRSALADYYSFYPQIYEPRQKRAGYYLYMAKGFVPTNIDQYCMNVIEIHSPFLQQDLDRDDKFGIDSLLYTLVGQREIKFLPKLPASYDEAMQVFSRWTLADHASHPIIKENVVAGGDRWLREEVENSAAKDATGKYVLNIRETPWGKKSVSFKVNPSPYLYQDKDVHTVGRNSTRLLKDWLKEHPQLDGVIVDSLGANWPATANYRRDHMAYAQYPVTFDPQGNLFINNDTSHYEWVKYTREQVLGQGQALSGNGVYAYRTSIPEHYRAKDRSHRIKVGRFFTSTFLDSGTSEIGARATIERCQDVRIMFGRKYYALINYDWEDQSKVRQFFNRSLLYGIFASNTKNYFGGGEYVEHVHEGIDYLANPQGYFRDKPLHDWFLPLAQMLYAAGWQPVTHARLAEGSQKALYVERYGAGNKVYFVVFNDSGSKAEVSVKVDLLALGFTEGTADYQELAHDAELSMPENDVFRLTLDAYQACVVSMSKTWLWGRNVQPSKDGVRVAAAAAQ